MSNITFLYLFSGAAPTLTKAARALNRGKASATFPNGAVCVLTRRRRR